MAAKRKAGQGESETVVADDGGRSPSQASWGVLASPVLVLNLNYVPINVSTARRAIILLGKGKAELLENHRGQVRTVSTVVEVPSIIRLGYLVKRPFAPRKLSKKEIFLRDRYTCQYCGTKSQQLTLDHVVPRRQKGSEPTAFP